MWVATKVTSRGGKEAQWAKAGVSEFVKVTQGWVSSLR